MSDQIKGSTMASTKVSTMVSFRQNIAFSIAVLGLSAVMTSSACDAQQRAVNYNGLGGIGSTISVSSLRVPEKALRHFDKAKSFDQHSRLAEADAEAQKAIVIDPDFAAAHLLRASVQVKEHSFLAAISSVAEARRIEPDTQWSGVVLASAYNGLHRYAEAGDALEHLKGDEASSWQAAYERARSAIGLRDISAALRWSEAALSGAPADFADRLLVRANSLVLAGRWRDAASQLEAYLKTKGSAQRRPQVLAALAEENARAREEDLARIASR